VGIGVLAFSSISLLIITFLANRGFLKASPGFFSSTNSVSFALGTLLYLFFAAAITISLAILLDQFKNKLNTSASITSTDAIYIDSTSDNTITQNEILQRKIDLQNKVNEITKVMYSIHESQLLLQQTVDQLKDQLDLYYAGVFLQDEHFEFAVLRAGTGDAGREMVTRHHRLQISGTSMIGQTFATQKPRAAMNIASEIIHFRNPLLPDTQSELALPILYKNNILGAMTIQSTRLNAFDDEDIKTLESICLHLGIALENARQFESNDDAINRFRDISRQYTSQSWEDVIDRSDVVESLYENPIQSEASDTVQTFELPIKVRDEIIGSIQIESSNHTLSEDDLNLIEAISTQTGLALDNARPVSYTHLTLPTTPYV
jgi:GAF domain-containing protein